MSAQVAIVVALGQHDVLAVRTRPLHELVLEHQRSEGRGPRHHDP